MARSSGRGAFLVGAGILLSRLAGLVRLRVFAHYLGQGDEADILTQSLRIPNLLQNLFGEGVLSASFVPVYARLLGEGKEEEAGKVAGAVLGLLGFLVSVIVLAGVVFTPLFVNTLVPGYEGHKRMLTITLVRILFPATGLLVMSAWCLGVLNSHRKFFLSYAAPVMWNLTIIAAALGGARTENPEGLIVVIAWAAVAGSLLQVLVQLPMVFTLLRGFRLAVRTTTPEVRTVVRNFWPAMVGRGANQISAYADGVIASLLGRGAAAAVGNAQLLYTLPVSLFGMAVSAAELPAMSAETGTGAERAVALRQRLEEGLHRIAFFIVPCVIAFIALGHVVAGAIFQSGRFHADDTRYVWAILAGSSVGLLASTLSRLSVSTFYAMGDTRTPLRFAVIRVILTIALGFPAALLLPSLLGVEMKWGAVGLTATAGIAGWVEYLLLRRRLAALIGPSNLSSAYILKLYGAALGAAAVGWAILLAIGGQATKPLVAAIAVLVPYALVYGVITLLLGIPAAVGLAAGIRRRV